MKLDRSTILLLIFCSIVLSLSTYRYLTPNRFDEELGPPSTEIWKIDEVVFNIKLVEIRDNLRLANFEYNSTVYELGEDTWLTLGNHTFKIRIYPDRQYVWFKLN